LGIVAAGMAERREAMRIVSDKYTAIGGKIGTMVGMMNKSGMCFRNWVTPANPNTAAQQGVRATLAALATAWSETVTPAQRLGWDAYAATLEFTSKLGTVYTISGFAAYCGANAARIVAALARIDAPPTLGGFATFTSPTVTFTLADDKVNVAYTNTDAWAGEVGGVMTVRLCPIGFSEGIAFYEGPFLYLGKVEGAVVPPTPPYVVTSGLTIALDVQYAVAIRVARADGRYSQERFFRGLGA